MRVRPAVYLKCGLAKQHPIKMQIREATPKCIRDLTELTVAKPPTNKPTRNLPMRGELGSKDGVKESKSTEYRK